MGSEMCIRDRLALLGRGKERLGELSVKLDRTEATFDAASLRVVPDVATNSLLVLAPADAFPFVDGYIQLMDQEPSTQHSTIRTFDLRYADSSQLIRTFGQIYRRPRGNSGQPAPGFAADTRTNSIVVTGSAEQMKEIETLLAKLDRETVLDKAPLNVIELVSASARRVAEILDTVVVGDDQALRSRIMILPDEDAGV